MIERIRLTAIAKNQLISLKRKTGIEHYNSLCRHALCLSLSNPTSPPAEELNFNGGLEIDWRIFTGGFENIYTNLILIRLLEDQLSINIETLREMTHRHVHRGLSYLASKSEKELNILLTKNLLQKLRDE